jgi:Mor family transcriptional regulator
LFTYFTIDSKLTSSSTVETSHPYFFNYPPPPTDLYQTSTQSVAVHQYQNYQAYNHDQFVQQHHHYFENSPGNLNSYTNFVSCQNQAEWMPTNQQTSTLNEPTTTIQSQENNFPQVISNNNELYEFLPEEIFQLDHPIVPKSETTQQNYNEIHSNYEVVSSPSFIDLSSSQQQQSKFPSTSSSTTTLIDAEINNNMNYQLDESNTISSNMKTQHEYANKSSFYCNENEQKISRKRNYDVEHSSKHHNNLNNNGQTTTHTMHHHNGYHSTNLMYSSKKGENASCFVQLYNHANNRYSSEMYGRTNEVYRTAEKFNNFITN